MCRPRDHLSAAHCRDRWVSWPTTSLAKRSHPNGQRTACILIRSHREALAASTSGPKAPASGLRKHIAARRGHFPGADPREDPRDNLYQCACMVSGGKCERPDALKTAGLQVSRSGPSRTIKPSAPMLQKRSGARNGAPRRNRSRTMTFITVRSTRTCSQNPTSPTKIKSSMQPA